MRRGSLDDFFNPASVAVVGASDRPRKLSKYLTENLLKGPPERKVYFINPAHEKVFGLKCYRSVKELPEVPSLTVLIVPARTTVQVLKESGEFGVKSAIVVSGGFKESGEEGASLEKEVLRISKEYGMRIMGPNCMGVFDNYSGTDTFFVSRSKIGYPQKGKISLIGQSGAVLTILADLLGYHGLGISKVVNYGNAADVDESELLEYLAEDKTTDLVLMYVEAVKDGKKFLRSALRCAKRKPIVALKAGKLNAGTRAVMSHTGSMAGRREIYSAAFKQGGILEVDGYEELLDASKVLLMQPPAKSNRILIITNSGGFGVIAADIAASEGLDVIPLRDEIQMELRKQFPPYFSLPNPIDLTGGGTNEDYRVSLEIAFAKNDQYDAAILIALFDVDSIDEGLVDAARAALEGCEKPLVACTSGGAIAKKFADLFESAGIPTYPSPERAARAIRYAAQRGAILERVSKD